MQPDPPIHNLKPLLLIHPQEAILNQAFGYESLELVEFLLDHGADPNFRNVNAR